MSDTQTDAAIRVYDEQAEQFAKRRRADGVEHGWLRRFLDLLPEEPAVLDAGCGTGTPVAAALIAQGCKVTGIDAAAGMLELARAAFPEATWLLGDFRDLPDTGDFDGIVAWHSFFHLDAPAQRRALPDLALRVKPGGAVLMTVGDRPGPVYGQVAGHPVFHDSLDEAEYRGIMTQAGFETLAFQRNDPDCGGATVLLCRRMEGLS